MTVALKGEYIPQNKEKYMGMTNPIYRSSWERDLMLHCDLHPDVVAWQSEPVKIPYSDPLTGDQKIYIPDFLITTLVNGEKVTKLIEIKPMHEATETHVRNATDDAILMRNNAKWSAAMAWCMRRGIEFKVLTEADMFLGGGNTPATRHYYKSQAKKVKAANIKRAKIKRVQKKAKAAVKAINNRKKIMATKTRRTPRSRRTRRI